MATIDPDLISVAPSGRYGFYVPQHRPVGSFGPVVQIAQFIEGHGWCGTPAQHYADTVVQSTTTCWSIDHGQGWRLNEDDTNAFRDYAALMLDLASAVSQ